MRIRSRYSPSSRWIESQRALPPLELTRRRRGLARRRRRGRHRARVRKQRPVLRARHQLVDLQRDAGDVDGRRGPEPLDVAREHAPQRQEARRLETGQSRVGSLQRGERSRHVAGDLKFLRAERDQPLHLDEHGLVTTARKVRVQLLERLALALDFGEARLEHGGLLPRRARFGVGARGGFRGGGRRLLQLRQAARRLALDRSELGVRQRADGDDEQQREQRQPRHAGASGRRDANGLDDRGWRDRRFRARGRFGAHVGREGGSNGCDVTVAARATGRR